MTLIHGNPILNTVYWKEDHPEALCLQMAEKVGARVGDTIVFDQTHKPWHRRTQGIHFVNAGSVGRPKNGDWRACYVLLHLDGGGGPGDWGGTTSEFAEVLPTDGATGPR